MSIRQRMVLGLAFVVLVFVFAVVVLVRWSTRPPPVVTLDLLQVSGVKQEGDSRERTYLCDVVLDNQSDEELSVAYTSAPFDGFRLILRRHELNVAEQPYAPSPGTGSRTQRYRLPPGKTPATLRFSVALAPGLGDTIDASIMGTLPGSRFRGVLESPQVRVRWVDKMGAD